MPIRLFGFSARLATLAVVLVLALGAGPLNSGAALAVDAPTVTSMSPTTGSTGSTVTLTGTNFVVGGTSVSFGGTAAAVTCTSTTSCTATVPAGTGTVAVQVSIGTVGFVNAGTFTYTTTARNSAASGPSVSYAAGWNLVSAPGGTTFASAQNPLYTFQGTDSNYQTLPNTSGVMWGIGYWAFFNSSTTVNLPTPRANGPFEISAPAGHWVMVGNPSATTPLTVHGADTVFTYDPVAGYVSPAGNLLPPGRGAWALSLNGGTIAVSP